MPFKSDETNPSVGRPKGTPNVATRDARRAIADFVEGNVDRLNGWLDQIAETNPTAAFDRFMNVVEYHVPRLARQEITGKDGDDITIRMARHYTADDMELLRRYFDKSASVEGQSQQRQIAPPDEEPIDE